MLTKKKVRGCSYLWDVARQLGKPDWEDYTNRSLVHRSKNNTLTSVSAGEDLDALEEDDPDSGDSVCSDEGDQLDQKGSNDNDVESEEEKPLNRYQHLQTFYLVEGVY